MEFCRSFWLKTTLLRAKIGSKCPKHDFLHNSLRFHPIVYFKWPQPMVYIVEHLMKDNWSQKSNICRSFWLKMILRGVKIGFPHLRVVFSQIDLQKSIFWLPSDFWEMFYYENHCLQAFKVHCRMKIKWVVKKIVFWAIVTLFWPSGE